jgi:transcription antitermination factor NusG
MIANQEIPQLGSDSCVLDSYSHPQWYAAYTRSRHEKKVADELEQRCVECYLPSYTAAHQWKDRRMKVVLPLFPGYVFIRVALRERLKVVTVSGLVRLVGFGQPVPLPEGDVERLRQLLSRNQAEPHPYLAPGSRVQICAGPLAGLEGRVLRNKGKLAFVVSVDLIMRSVAVEVSAADLEPLSLNSAAQDPASLAA